MGPHGNATRKYGKDAFSHEVLEVHTDLDQANLAEEWWIRKLDIRNPKNGFNLKNGGNHVPHPIKNAMKRPDILEKCRRGVIKSLLDPKVCERRSEAAKKKWQNLEHREKMMAVSRRNAVDPLVLAKISAANKGKKRTPEQSKAASESIKKLWKNPAYRKNRGLDPVV